MSLDFGDYCDALEFTNKAHIFLTVCFSWFDAYFRNQLAIPFVWSMLLSQFIVLHTEVWIEKRDIQSGNLRWFYVHKMSWQGDPGGGLKSEKGVNINSE
jgi:hypothetical protein